MSLWSRLTQSSPDDNLASAFPRIIAEHWGSQVLAENQVSPQDTVLAVKTLRTANRTLSLLAAKRVVDEIANKDA